MKDPKTIVITGASSGIGAALAKHYAGPGIRLYVTGRNMGRLSEVARECEQRGAVVEAITIDVTQTDALEQKLLAIDAAYPVDLLIANAGVSGGSGGHAVLGEEASQVRHIMATNVDGMINTVTPLIAPMAKRGRGQIAVMASLASFRGLPSAPAYSTSKAAVRIYGEGLRGLLSAKGVEVSVICPGYIATPMTSKNPFPMPLIMPPEKAARIIAKGLRGNKARIAFPLAMYLPIYLICMLPPWITDPIFSRLPAKPEITP